MLRLDLTRDVAFDKMKAMVEGAAMCAKNCPELAYIVTQGDG